MRRKLKWLIPLLILLVLAGGFLIYTGNYYHADGAALAALDPDTTVAVSRTDYGWHFDGPGEDAALIFYPGAKVEASAYAPFCACLRTAAWTPVWWKCPSASRSWA